MSSNEPRRDQETSANARAPETVDQQPVAYSGQPARGQHLRYRVLRRHAQGGLGQVSVALDEELNREVAFKEIQDAFADVPAYRARFVQEAEITGRLEHPAVVPVYGLGADENGRPYYAMRFVQGDNLHDAVKRYHAQPLQRVGFDGIEFRNFLRRFIDLCNAVAFAHSRGVLHRDVKPANVMLGNYGETLVVDWGMAKSVGSGQWAVGSEDRSNHPEIRAGDGGKSPPTVQGQALGTPGYMSPEQAAGRIDELGPATDIYSLGATLYEILTGRPPFVGELGEVVSQIRRGAFEPPREISPAVPRSLNAVCLKAMALDPASRYATATDLAADVERWLADEPVTAWREPLGVRGRRWMKRHRGFVAAAVALLLTAIVALAIGFVLVRSERDAKELARAESDRQREIAAEVNDFLCRDLLLQADSREQAERGFAQDPDITVKTALGRAAERIGDRFRDKPLVEAAVRAAIGDAFRGVGEPSAAISHLERAVQLRSDALGADHVDTLVTRSSLGLTYRAAGRVDEAGRLFDGLLPEARAALGPDHRETMAIQANLAGVREADGRTGDAIRLLEELTRDHSTALASDPALALAVRNNLATSYRGAGRYAEAHRLYREVVDELTARSGPEHPDTLSALNCLAVTLQELDRTTEALEVHKKVLLARQKNLGPGHPETLDAENNLAESMRAAGQYAEATERFESLWARSKAKFGPDHPRTLTLLNNFATASRSAGRVADAVRLFESGRDLWSAKFGPDHPNTLVAENNLGNAYRAAGRTADAIHVFESVAARQTAKIGADHPHTLSTQNNLAGAYQASGRLAEAITLFESVVDRRAAKLGADHTDTVTARNNLALAYRADGRVADAVKLLEAVVERRKTANGPDHPDTLTAQNNLAGAYGAAGRVADALRLYEDVFARFRSKLGSDHRHTLTAQNNVGQAYRTVGRTAEAIPLLEHSAEKFLAKLGPDHPDTLGVQNSLAGAYREVGRSADAVPLLETVLRFRRAKPGPEHAETLSSMISLAEAYMETPRHADAESLLRECLSVREAKQPDAWTTFNTRSVLGACLTGQKEFTGAEPLLVQGYEGIKQRADKIPTSVRRQRLTEALDRLVKLYDGWGKAEEAAKWRKELESTRKQ